MTTRPCKSCGRTGWKVSIDLLGKIIKDKCLYCNGKGYIFELSKKEVKEENGILD